jgi:hypothetical protein
MGGSTFLRPRNGSQERRREKGTCGTGTFRSLRLYVGLQPFCGYCGGGVVVMPVDWAALDFCISRSFW